MSAKNSNLKIGLLQFPGSNCDMDCKNALAEHFNISVIPIWHKEHQLPVLDGLILPGGFSYGDYLRGGALASMSSILNEVKAFALTGKPVIGICNGFQILTEAQLLPGTLLKNLKPKFICKHVKLKTHRGPSLYQKTLAKQTLDIPIAHGEGRYYIDGDGLKRLQDQDQIVFTYEGQNPNGSVESIAGVTNTQGNVFGLMPHPERAMDKNLGGSQDGRLVWEAFLAQCN